MIRGPVEVLGKDCADRPSRLALHLECLEVEKPIEIVATGTRANVLRPHGWLIPAHQW
jgi:hypothetical protein